LSKTPGVRFKDVDLIGFPIKIVVGAKSLEKGNIEIKLRKNSEVQVVRKEEAVSKVKAILKEI